MNIVASKSFKYFIFNFDDSCFLRMSHTNENVHRETPSQELQKTPCVSALAVEDTTCLMILYSVRRTLLFLLDYVVNLKYQANLL